MIPELPALLVRGTGLLLPLLGIVALCLWRVPRQREVAAVIVASGWALLTLIPLNLVALRAGWWSFHAEGAVWLGMPVDLLLAWVLLWGALPALMLRLLPVPLVTGLLVWLDVILMPLGEPVVVLGELWLVGEMLGAAFCLIPALMLAFWTRRRQLVHARMWAQAVLSFGLMVALPVCVLATAPPPLLRAAPESLSAVLPFEPPVPELWTGWSDWSAWSASPEALTIGLQLLALVCLPGLAAAREFAAVGNGTPLPYDPPTRLVTSGPYAYVRNPMQLTMVLVYLVLGALYPPLLLGALVALAYGAGFASWHEGGQLRAEFGRDWDAYRSGVRAWLPRLRPWSGRARGTLYVAMDCGMCRGLGSWVAARGPTALTFRPAAEHPEVLYRLTYENAEGVRWSGVAALARAMDHLHLGWAVTGWALSLPVLRHFVQLCGDAFGAGPRPSRKAHETDSPAVSAANI
ncbi:isoprenylcysteine carboxylmethyltransferase family protein [Nocardiopsis exhalans]|uniref:Isoprenylcysteine carboxylmethyltransferase family protein n=1 Tax=Nocardiopsis exhalans TaxID=163604 RepID=A0ABY5DDM0_9ACTN|nr:methyltransferase [Nocardiopsis exhalans]USY21176.1 isoprenylcysteine carboxylmethyltransferase family protein [Nocardiopsis exhalans]